MFFGLFFGFLFPFEMVFEWLWNVFSLSWISRWVFEFQMEARTLHAMGSWWNLQFQIIINYDIMNWQVYEISRIVISYLDRHTYIWVKLGSDKNSIYAWRRINRWLQTVILWLVKTCIQAFTQNVNGKKSMILTFFFKYLIPKYYGKYKMLLDVCKCLILRYALLFISVPSWIRKQIFRCIMRKYYEILLLQRNLRYQYIKKLPSICLLKLYCWKYNVLKGAKQNMCSSWTSLYGTIRITLKSKVISLRSSSLNFAMC